MMRLAPASCGTEGLDIFITKNFQICRIWYVACPLFLLVQMKFVKDACFGKNIKKAFPSGDSRAQGILDLVHSDVCGPMSPASLSGCLYYVIFIDDCSRKCWIYFLKAKSDTFDKFKEYKAFIEKQTGKHIRTLRTNNGGEVESVQFKDFYKEARITK